jgi:coiled-coil domain-containing protein 40
VQHNLDKLGATLRQVEAHNDAVRGEIAVTRRAAAAAEDAVQRLEKEKQQQDYLIDDLQARACGIIWLMRLMSICTGLRGQAQPHKLCLHIACPQETMRSLQQQHALYSAQLVSQARETRAAKEMLAEAESEMEGVRFEKKQLLAQWRGSLNAIQRCVVVWSRLNNQCSLQCV